MKQEGGNQHQQRLFAMGGAFLPDAPPMATGGPWDFGGAGSNPEISSSLISGDFKGLITDMTSSFNFLNSDVQQTFGTLGIASLVIGDKFGTEFEGLFGKPTKIFGDPLNEISQGSWVSTLISNGSKNGLFSSRQQ